MDEQESCELVLLVKELKLAVKFPCRLTLQHAGRPLSPEIQSDGSNVFPVGRDISLKEDKRKDHAEINVNLATDKGGNIMAGIIKINLKDISSSQGQTLTLSLQKCLDPYATCLVVVKSVKISRSRVKKGALADDWKQNRYQSKSDAPGMDIRNFKPRSKFNDLDSSIGPKRVTINQLASPMNSHVKEKALSTIGGYQGVNTSIDREALGSRFKHLGRKDDDGHKSMVGGGKYRDVDESFKASLQASEKTLKLQILKHKTKYQQSERSLQEKTKQIKSLKEQISDLNRQQTQKHFLVQQLNSKNSHIAKLQESNKSLSRQLHDQRNKIIDLQREIQQQKNSNYTSMSRYKQDIDKKQHDLQKSLYDKKEQIKDIMEENQYKNNQIHKMKVLIEDLQSNLQTKTYQFDKLYSHQKTQHHKTKIVLEQKINQLTNDVKKYEQKEELMSQELVKSEEENKRLQNKISFIDRSAAQQAQKYKDQVHLKEKQTHQRKRLEKVEEQFSHKIKALMKDQSSKHKEIEQLSHELSESSSASKKKINQLIEKNKNYASKVQQLENKVNILAASQEKLKRNLEMSQKQVKNLQQNEKLIIKNSKLKDDRILQMERQLTQFESKHTMKDSLGKKQAEYKAIQLQKITVRATQLQKNYEREKQSSEDRRLELLKSENKVRMLEESVSRLNDQIKDIKTTNIKREDEWIDKLKQSKEDLKKAEEKQSQYNKQLHSAQIQKINLKNELNRLQKQIQNYTQKCQRYKKRQSEQDSTIKNLSQQIQLKNEEIVTIESTYKMLENEHNSLKADKSKTEKITSIIKEEKVIAVSDMNKLKKQIERREQKEQQYLEQIKKMKEEMTKWELKWNALSKQSDKYKNVLSDNIRNLLGNKSIFSVIDSLSHNNDNSRNFINRSKFRTPAETTSGNETGESRLVQIIEQYSRESHQAVVMLNEEVKKLKKDKQMLEKDLHNITVRSHDTEEEKDKKIMELMAEIDTITSENTGEMEQYEERIMADEKQIQRRQKNISDLIDQIEQLKMIQGNQAAAHESAVSELLSKIHHLKSKLADSQAKDEGNTVIFVNLEEKLASLQAQNTELIHQNEVLADHLLKKEKQCGLKIEQNEDLSQQLESVKKVKADLFSQLLSVKQCLTVEKQSLKHTSSDLKEEESKNSHLKMFNTEILKQKQILIKKEAELSQKINGIEDKVQILQVELAQKSQELSKREKIITEYRQSSKEMHLENANSQSMVSDLRLELQRQKQKVKDRQRKIIQKQQQINTLNSQSKKTISKLEGQIALLNEQVENLTDTMRKQQNVSTSKINDLELQVRKLTEVENKLSQANTSLQEQIFFEKQMHSLAQGKAEELQQQINKINMESDKLQISINELNDELRQKDENLFALSGKLYNSDLRLQSKEEQFRSKAEKMDLQWRYKIDEICQEYETKIDVMERQRSYVKTDIEGVSETVQKLESEKTNLRIQLDRERQNWQAKIKKVEEEKLISLIEKNRQIEKIKEMFEQLEQKLKRKDYELRNMEEDKRKNEQKLKQLKSDLERSEQKKNESIEKFERQIDQMKRKEGQLKRFKDALRNSQWTTERQIKKGIQNCAKTLVTLSVEKNKDEVMNLMKNLQTSIAKVACQNIDQI